MTKPLVSIIIPIYKAERYLNATVDSVLTQTYQNLEVVLIDDGSPDRSGAICDEYAQKDSRVLVIHKENGGQGMGRNVGMDNCSGDYIMFLDSDDLMAQDCVEYLLTICAENDCDMAVCDVAFFNDGAVPIFDLGLGWKAEELTRHEAVKRWLYGSLRGGLEGKLFPRKMLDALRNPEGIYYEDIRPLYHALCAAECVALGLAKKSGYRDRSSGQSKERFSLREMSCVYEMGYVYDDVTAKYPDLLKAAASPKLSANAHVFIKIQDKAFSQQLDMCWENIEALRWTVLSDPSARKKAWCFALLSYSGKELTHKISVGLMGNKWSR